MTQGSEPSKSARGGGRPTLRRIVAPLLLIGALVAWGADRQPADATRPVVWQEPTVVRPPAADELRLASFNIHGGKGADNRLDLSRTASQLDGVDVAGLYEVRATPWGNQAQELGERLDMRSAFLGTERRWWHDHFGNALLTTRPIAGIQRIPLVGTRGKAFRQAVLVDVPLQSATVRVLMAHVDRERDREQQLAAVIRLFLSLNPPAVLMGDLNSGPNDPQLAGLLAEPGVDSVIGAQAPSDNIDWIITRGLTCSGAVYQSTGASDHPVVKATLRLPE